MSAVVLSVPSPAQATISTSASTGSGEVGEGGAVLVEADEQAAGALDQRPAGASPAGRPPRRRAAARSTGGRPLTRAAAAGESGSG